ncbi:MAG TPA: hypothetical protein DCE14_09655 [Kosmotogaceae bacterium]|nr:hypothetical protein [Kosmotogaceae bacterium]
MFASLVKEKRISTSMAVTAVILGIVGTVFMFIGAVAAAEAAYYDDFDMMTGASAVMILAGLLGLVSGILQAVVMYQWSCGLKTNIENTRVIMTGLSKKITDSEKTDVIDLFSTRLSGMQLPVWAYWLYVVLYIIGLFSGAYAILFFVLGFIFLAIYLHGVFSVSESLQDMKGKIYPFLLEKVVFEDIRKINKRNIGLFILLSIVTFGIYWYYLIIKLSSEINAYTDIDSRLRESVYSKLEEKKA